MGQTNDKYDGADLSVLPIHLTTPQTQAIKAVQSVRSINDVFRPSILPSQRRFSDGQTPPVPIRTVSLLNVNAVVPLPPTPSPGRPLSEEEAADLPMPPSPNTLLESRMVSAAASCIDLREQPIKASRVALRPPTTKPTPIPASCVDLRYRETTKTTTTTTTTTSCLDLRYRADAAAAAASAKLTSRCTPRSNLTKLDNLHDPLGDLYAPRENLTESSAIAASELTLDDLLTMSGGARQRTSITSCASSSTSVEQPVQHKITKVQKMITRTRKKQDKTKQRQANNHHNKRGFMGRFRSTPDLSGTDSDSSECSLQTSFKAKSSVNLDKDINTSVLKLARELKDITGKIEALHVETMSMEESNAQINLLALERDMCLMSLKAAKQLKDDYLNQNQLKQQSQQLSKSSGCLNRRTPIYDHGDTGMRETGGGGGVKEEEEKGAYV